MYNRGPPQVKLKSQTADKGIISPVWRLILCNSESSVFIIIADNENLVLNKAKIMLGFMNFDLSLKPVQAINFSWYDCWSKELTDLSWLRLKHLEIFYSLCYYYSAFWGPSQVFFFFFFFWNRGTREQRSKHEGNSGTKAILGNREHRKSRFWFWGRGEPSDLFQGNKGTGSP